uniref:Leucine rich repeat containing 56 n=1 Tax=Chelydra serpentina TaxID=8475 RepID=A0A8C3RV71_CHESE
PPPTQADVAGPLPDACLDLGTTLSHLQVLWMARCGLTDLDGISSCSSLKELYIAYNNISDLSQVSLLDHLEILDLEGNNIEDINQIQYLGLCGKLNSLTVEGNLICLKPNPEFSEVPDYNYRAEVKKLIPHLKYLDEILATQITIPPSRKMNKDWLIVKESIKEGSLAKDISRFGMSNFSPFIGADVNTQSIGLYPWSSWPTAIDGSGGGIAQWFEHWPAKPRVVSSILEGRVGLDDLLRSFLTLIFYDSMIYLPWTLSKSFLTPVIVLAFTTSPGNEFRRLTVRCVKKYFLIFFLNLLPVNVIGSPLVHVLCFYILHDMCFTMVS